MRCVGALVGEEGHPQGVSSGKRCMGDWVGAVHICGVGRAEQNWAMQRAVAGWGCMWGEEACKTGNSAATVTYS